MRRVLLLETRHGERHRHHRAEFYPYLLGLIRQQAWEGAWWVLTVPAEHVHVGRRYVTDLPATLRERLVRELSVWRPDTVVCHDRPAPALLAAMREPLPDLRLVDLTRPPGPFGLRGVLDEAGRPVRRIARQLGLPGRGTRGGTDKDAGAGSAVHHRTTVGTALRLLGGLWAGGDDGALLVDVLPPCFERRALDDGEAGAPRGAPGSVTGRYSGKRAKVI